MRAIDIIRIVRNEDACPECRRRAAVAYVNGPKATQKAVSNRDPGAAVMAWKIIDQGPGTLRHTYRLGCQEPRPNNTCPACRQIEIPHGETGSLTTCPSCGTTLQVYETYERTGSTVFNEMYALRQSWKVAK